MNIRATVTLLLLAVLAIPSLATAQQRRQPMVQGPLTLELAQQAMDAAQAEAVANSWNVTIVITDTDGVPIYLRRLNGASPRSYDIAYNKALTVAATGMSTTAYGQGVESGDVTAIPDGINFAGGVPIVIGGEVVGAIGTSGVQAGQDEQVSEAGANAIAN